MEYVASILTEEAFETELVDDREGDYRLDGVNEEGLLSLVSETETLLVPFESLEEIAEIKEFDWKLLTDFGSTFSRGNTNSDTINWHGELEIEFGDRRILADLQAITESRDDDRIKNQFRVNAAYNYTFADPWFFAIDLNTERDPVAQLQRRISVNPSIGYDFWDDASRTLRFQLGAGYQNERFELTEDNSSLIDWRLRFTYDLKGGDIELSHNHHIYRNLQGRKNTVFNSKTGVRYDITDDIYFNVQLNYDYDTKPAEGTDADDVTLLFGAGIEL